MLTTARIDQDGTFVVTADNLPRNLADELSGYVVATSALTPADLSTLLPGDLFGRWEDPATGIVYLDRVTIFADLDEALALGRARGEIAIWDADNACEIAC